MTKAAVVVRPPPPRQVVRSWCVGEPWPDSRPSTFPRDWIREPRREPRFRIPHRRSEDLRCVPAERIPPFTGSPAAVPRFDPLPGERPPTPCGAPISRPSAPCGASDPAVHVLRRSRTVSVRALRRFRSRRPRLSARLTVPLRVLRRFGVDPPRRSASDRARLRLAAPPGCRGLPAARSDHRGDATAARRRSGVGSVPGFPGPGWGSSDREVLPAAV